MEGVHAKYRGQCPAHTRHVLSTRGQAGVPAYGEQWDFADAVFCRSRSNFLLARLSFLLFLLTASVPLVTVYHRHALAQTFLFIYFQEREVEPGGGAERKGEG